MKTYRLEVFSDEPIVVTYVSKEYKIVEDMPRSDAELRAILENVSEPLFDIVEASALPVSLDDVILSSNKGARGEQPIWHHPKVREMIFVHPSALVKLAARGLNTVTFGNLNAQVFSNLEDALAYARSKVHEQKG